MHSWQHYNAMHRRYIEFLLRGRESIQYKVAESQIQTHSYAHTNPDLESRKERDEKWTPRREFLCFEFALTQILAQKAARKKERREVCFGGEWVRCVCEQIHFMGISLNNYHNSNSSLHNVWTKHPTTPARQRVNLSVREQGRQTHSV